MTQLIGFDAGPRDLKRYARSENHQTDKRFSMRFPLIEWAMAREDCISAIQAAGLPVPPKSSCVMCCAAKPRELSSYEQGDLRVIVLMEAVAAPRLTKCEGLWRKAIAGKRGGQARPGAMTDYIRQQALLSEKEIDQIIHAGPAVLERWKAHQAALPLAERETMSAWVAKFRRGLGRKLINGLEVRRLA